MYRAQCSVLTFAALAISGTAVLIWWWRSELKKRRAKNEASMALAAHEMNQCDKSPTVEKEEETESNSSASYKMAPQDIHSKTSTGGYRSVYIKSVKSVSEMQEVITHSKNIWSIPEWTVMSWTQEETTSWSRIYYQRTTSWTFRRFLLISTESITAVVVIPPTNIPFYLLTLPPVDLASNH